MKVSYIPILTQQEETGNGDPTTQAPEKDSPFLRMAGRPAASWLEWLTIRDLTFRERFNVILTGLVMATATVLTEWLPTCITHCIQPF
jgi:hypothetical protein